jgi:hypothetical protein
VNYPEDGNVKPIDRIDNNELSNRETAQPNAKIAVPGTTRIWEIGQQKEPLCDAVYQASSSIDAAALPRHVKPNIFKVVCSLGRYFVSH